MKSKTLLVLFWLFACTGALADEGRIPITGPVIITTPGSYVLVNNIEAPFSGVVIRASNVKVDLNGFTVSPVAGANGSGVIVEPGHKNIEVTNGTITGFANHGIYVPGAEQPGRNLKFSHLRISEIRGVGISLENNAGFIVEDCLITGNNWGIYGTAAGLILNNVIGSNSRGLVVYSKQIGYRSNVFYGNGTDIDGQISNLGNNLCSGASCP
jgi:hypothetical protein